MISNMKANLLMRRRVVVAADAYVDIVVWHTPTAVPPSSHAFKYRLAYVVNGECVLRYDNERGKGDHRHVGVEEFAYHFSSPEQLLADFSADIERWNYEHGRT